MSYVDDRRPHYAKGTRTMLRCHKCGALISSHDAAEADRIAGQGRETLCPACAVILHYTGQADLIRELWDVSSPERRCPHVSHDGQRCRCGAVEEYSAE